jgi:hypothetical protein
VPVDTDGDPWVLARRNSPEGAFPVRDVKQASHLVKNRGPHLPAPTRGYGATARARGDVLMMAPKSAPAAQDDWLIT